jgi:uncharacterized protein (DUF924 family)
MCPDALQRWVAEMQDPEEVIRFWFVEHGFADWFGARPEFDAEIANRFAQTHAHVRLGEAWRWRRAPAGRLAEIVVLDQFSRQLYRNRPAAFAEDGMALVLAQVAVGLGADRLLPPVQRMFLYMPFMHAESVAVQEAAMPLFESVGIEDCRKSAVEHLALIRRFGRYPRRNAALGRESTPEELAYLAQAGDSMI